MSAQTATARPLRQPDVSPERRRHLEVAPSRAQRRARPRLVHAVTTLLGMVGILLAQLGLSIALADGAYHISALQLQQRDLLRDGEALAEGLESLQSPQYLAANAEALGMVASGSLPYIDLTTGSVDGKRGGTGGSMLGSRGSLVGNTTIEGLPIVQAGSIEPSTEPAGDATGGLVVISSGDSSSGASSTGGGTAPVSSGSGTLPSPTTH